jgi:hypothetical protein
MTAQPPLAAATAPWHGILPRITVLAPTAGADDLGTFLDQAPPAGGEPFGAVRMESLGRVSAAILADPVLRQDPASVAVAYWLRRSQLSRLADEQARRAATEPDVVRVPVGRVLHLAPSNVDTLFIYSWALAYLTGNASVVRLSQDSGIVVQALLGAIDSVAKDDRELRESIRFLTYVHEEAVTAALSAWCAHRFIWGGDETVAAIRPLPLPSHASERVFGSKYSFAVIGAERYRTAPAEDRAQVAAGFFNDLFWFDQMACSSPQVVFWVGAPGPAEAGAAEFERTLQAEVERRGFVPPVSSAVHRRTYAFGFAASHAARVELAHSGFVGLHLHDRGELDKEVCGGGLIRHVQVARLDEVLPFVGEADQTLAHWGLEAEALRRFAREAGSRGLDRLVPIGEALAFDTVWDGFQLVDDLLRRVRVRGV